jgi:hypothetical protein
MATSRASRVCAAMTVIEGSAQGKCQWGGSKNDGQCDHDATILKP